MHTYPADKLHKRLKNIRKLSQVCWTRKKTINASSISNTLVLRTTELNSNAIQSDHAYELEALGFTFS